MRTFPAASTASDCYAVTSSRVLLLAHPGRRNAGRLVYLRGGLEEADGADDPPGPTMRRKAATRARRVVGTTRAADPHKSRSSSSSPPMTTSRRASSWRSSVAATADDACTAPATPFRPSTPNASEPRSTTSEHPSVRLEQSRRGRPRGRRRDDAQPRPHPEPAALPHLDRRGLGGAVLGTEVHPGPEQL
jgi:hypothetical protein